MYTQKEYDEVCEIMIAALDLMEDDETTDIAVTIDSEHTIYSLGDYDSIGNLEFNAFENNNEIQNEKSSEPATTESQLKNYCNVKTRISKPNKSKNVNSWTSGIYLKMLIKNIWHKYKVIFSHSLCRVGKFETVVRIMVSSGIF